ncbi:MAG TPA: plastocyanin/azurin family copper-binding protein [Thermoplasmata archaeon]|nr:plastocyanin/azurin family copper-binding protein [Thermoplasmata archaeon]HLB68487.1 plastocyanin/azurin family copper-binding protein [Thermoplasmata archaeon]
MNRLAVFGAVAIAVLAIGIGALFLRSLSPSGSVAGVTISNYAFHPSTVTIRAGTTLQWTNMDTVAHTVTMGSHDDMMDSVDSGPMGHMATFSYKFMEPGTYAYHCDPHPYMTGTVVVTA